MADPYEGLSADAWKKALQEVRAQIPAMRQEAAALDAQLKGAGRSVRDLEAEARRGASIGGAATRRPDAKAMAAAEQELATAAERTAKAETEAAAARARSLDLIRRAAITLRTGDYGAIGGLGSAAAIERQALAYQRLLALQARLGGAGGAGFIGGGGFFGGGGQRLLPPGPPPRAQLGPGPAAPLGLPRPGETVGGTQYASGVYATQRAQQAAAGSTAAFSSNLQRNQAVLSANSREMRKFGALTTEFISAAGRGAVTVRELGFQVSSTIGKFGGWLAAGSAVYGAFGAIQAVGRGAIDTQSGIQQLNRVVSDVNADDAAEQFRDLADSFNLPIADVSNAAFEMGKIFTNQNDALEATKAVLASVKVGELDVATSSRYLTSVIAAFGLPASEMAGVFDQINQAQNTFGIRIQDTLAGLAKASGTFKAAGGDLNTLLALITTARRATGQTGEVIGTALARAPNFLRKPQNVDVLAGFGIDASQSITDVINEAFAKAQTLSGEKVQELAAAIFGPQYGARIGTPLFQQFDLYQQVLKDTSPEASKGSAQKELQSVLAETTEKLHKVIVQLEIMGSGLAEAGAFDAFGVLLDTLNLILTTTNSLINLFDDLPSPIRRAVVYMGEFAALVALARRFNVGQSFGGRSGGNPLGSLFTRRDQQGFLYKEALTNQRDSLSREAEGASQAAVRRSLDVEAAKSGLMQEEAAAAKLTAQNSQRVVVSAEQTVAQEARVAAARSQLTAATEAELAAMNRSRAVLKESLLVQADMTALRAGADAEQLARARGVIIPTTVGPDTARAARLADPDIQRTLAPDLIRAQNQIIGADLRSHQLPNTSRIKQVTARLQENAKQFGTVGGIMATGSQGITAGFNTAAANIKKINMASIGGAASRFATGLKGFGRSLLLSFGPLDAIIIGAILLFQGFSEASNQLKQADDAISAVPASAEEFSTQQAALAASANTGYTVIGALRGVVGKVADARKELSRRSAQRAAEIQALLAREQPASTEFLYEEDFTAQIGHITAAYKSGTDTGVQMAQRARALIHTIRVAQNLNDQQRNQLISQVRIARVEAKGNNATYTELAATAGDDLGQTITDYGKAVQTGMARLATRGQLIRRALIQASELMRSRDPVDVAAASDAFDTLVSSLTDAAQSELDRSLAFAKGQDERNAAYKDYLTATNPYLIQGHAESLIRDQRVRMEQNQRILRKEVSDYQRELRSGSAGAGAASGIAGSAIGGLAPGIGNLLNLGNVRQRLNLQPLIDELQKRGETTKEIRKRIREIQAAQKEAVARIREIRKQVQEQRYQENTDLIQARGDLSGARADEGLPALRIALSTIGRVLDRAIRQYGRNSKEVLDLLGQQQSARDAIVQEQAALIQARTDYTAAGLSGEGGEKAQQRAQLAGLQNLLAFYQAHPRQYSQSDVLGLEGQIREAQIALAQEAETDASELRDALFGVKQARAEGRGNDVRSARIQLNQALYDRRQANTPTERATAQQAVIRQRAALRDAIYQRQLEDIEFQADLGNLTLQQQIRAYQQLLNTANTTRDQRRDLRRRIEQLKNEAESESGSFDLNLGNIKLPTTYEIRRAIEGGGGRGGTNVSMSQENKFYVTGSNADEIVAKVSAKQQDAARRNRNMARSAGLN